MKENTRNKHSILEQVLRGILIALALATIVMAVLFLISKPKHLHRKRSVRTINEMNGLARAIESFEAEYEKLPTLPSPDFELEGPQAAELITVLLGKEDTARNMQNFRQSPFLTIQTSTNKKRGGLTLSPDQKPEGIYDAWGHPLRVILRPDGQSTLTLMHAGKQVITSKRFVVSSRGPDEKWFTEDDLVSDPPRR